jgi:recombinational DNA repair ATPase RecF
MGKPDVGEQSEEPEATRAMYPFSFDLHNGAHFFADAAVTEADEKRRRYLNTAAIVFAAATIEAVLNEQISLRSELGIDKHLSHIPHEFFEALANAQKTISLKDKWNLFTSVRGGRMWDSGVEPFQSYDLLISLRNELVHFKAEFLADQQAPLNKLQPLVDRLSLRLPPDEEKYHGYWLKTLLESTHLGPWIRKSLDYTAVLEAVLKRVP